MIWNLARWRPSLPSGGRAEVHRPLHLGRSVTPVHAQLKALSPFFFFFFKSILMEGRRVEENFLRRYMRKCPSIINCLPGRESSQQSIQAIELDPHFGKCDCCGSNFKWLQGKFLFLLSLKKFLVVYPILRNYANATVNLYSNVKSIRFIFL